jgi:hypothetical protein
LAQDVASGALAGKDLAAVSKPDSSPTQPLELPTDLLPQRHEDAAVSPPAAAPPAAEASVATGSMNEFGELTLLATGEWQAMQRSDTRSETKSEAAKSETKPERAQPTELTGAETLSLISKPAPVPEEPTVPRALLPEPVEPQRAANGE